HRRAGRLPARRLGDHRADLPAARPRHLRPAGHPEPRLHGSAGRRARPGADRDRHQPRRRPDVRVAQPEGAVDMSESIIPILEPVPVTPGRAPSTTWRRTWRRFRRQKTAMAGAIAIVVIATAALLAPVIAPYDIDEISSEFMASFSSSHWLGTDQT